MALRSFSQLTSAQQDSKQPLAAVACPQQLSSEGPGTPRAAAKAVCVIVRRRGTVEAAVRTARVTAQKVNAAEATARVSSTGTATGIAHVSVRDVTVLVAAVLQRVGETAVSAQHMRGEAARLRRSRAVADMAAAGKGGSMSIGNGAVHQLGTSSSRRMWIAHVLVPRTLTVMRGITGGLCQQCHSRSMSHILVMVAITGLSHGMSRGRDWHGIGMSGNVRTSTYVSTQKT